MKQKNVLSLLLAVVYIFSICAAAPVFADDNTAGKIINIPFTGFDTATDGYSSGSNINPSNAWASLLPGTASEYLPDEGAVSIFSGTEVSGSEQFGRRFLNDVPALDEAPYKIVGKLNVKPVSGATYFRLTDEGNSGSAGGSKASILQVGSSGYVGIQRDNGGATDVKQVATLTPGEWVNAVFVIDVTASDGTNTATYYINGETYTTTYDKSIITAAYPKVRFQNGVNAKAWIDNLGIYTAKSSSLPALTAKAETKDGAVYIEFSNEVFIGAFKDAANPENSIVTVTGQDGVAKAVPMSQISVMRDNVTLAIAPGAFTDGTEYTVAIGAGLKDVLGTELSGQAAFPVTVTPVIPDPVYKTDLLLFTDFSDDNTYSMDIVGIADATVWAPSNADTKSSLVKLSDGMQIFSAKNLSGTDAIAGSQFYHKKLDNAFPAASDAPYKLVGTLSAKLSDGSGIFYRLIKQDTSSAATLFALTKSGDKVLVGMPKEGATDVTATTPIAEIALDEWVNVTYVIDVTAADGTNTATYYVNGKKAGTTAFSKEVITARHPYVRFQNGAASVGAVSNLGLYAVSSNDLPPFTASIDSSKRYDAQKDRVAIVFSNEIEKTAFANPDDETNSVLTIKRSSSEETILPMDSLTVGADGKSLLIDNSYLTDGSSYEVAIRGEVKDVLGTALTGETVLTFETLKNEVLTNFPFTAFSSEDDGYSPIVSNSSTTAWRPWNSKTVTEYLPEEHAVKFFTQDTAGSQQFGRMMTSAIPAASEAPFSVVGKASIRAINGGFGLRLLNEGKGTVATLLHLRNQGDGTSVVSLQTNGGSNDKITTAATVSADQYTDVLFKIDVTDTDGTNTMTLYLNGAEYTTSFDKSVFAEARPGARFQNDTNGVGAVRSIGMYTVIGAAQPLTAALENTVVDALNEDVCLTFSNEIELSSFADPTNPEDSLLTLSDGSVSVPVPMSMLSVDAEQHKTLFISGEMLDAPATYTIIVDAAVQDIFKTAITGTREFEFTTISTVPIKGAEVTATSTAPESAPAYANDRYADTYWEAASDGESSITFAMESAQSFNATALNVLTSVPSYKISVKAEESDPWTVVADRPYNLRSGIVRDVFDQVTAKYIMVTFYGNRTQGMTDRVAAMLADINIATIDEKADTKADWNPEAATAVYGADGSLIPSLSGQSFGAAVLYLNGVEASIPFKLPRVNEDGYAFEELPVTFDSLPEGVDYQDGTLHIAASVASGSTAQFTSADGTPHTLVFTSDLARFRPVVQSTCQDGSSGANAVDGNTQTAWVSSTITNPSTIAEQMQYLTVDLQTPVTINKAVIHHTVSNNGADRINTFSILVSNDNKTWQMVKDTEFAQGTDGEHVYLFAPVTARYVRYSAVLQTSGNRWATLSSLSVYNTRAKSITLNLPASINPSDGEEILLSASVTDGEGVTTDVTSAASYATAYAGLSLDGRILTAAADCPAGTAEISASFGGASDTKTILVSQTVSVKNFQFDAGTLEAGKTVTASAKVRRTSSLPGGAVQMFAAYYEDGALKAIQMEPVEIPVSEDYTDVSASLTLPAAVSGSGYVKAFLWDAATIAPVVSPIGMGETALPASRNMVDFDGMEFYLCIGQSNMAGYQNQIPEEADPSDLPIPDGIYLANKSDVFVPATHSYSQYSTAMENNKSQTANSQISMTYSFSLKMRETMPDYKKLGLVVNPRSGSNINNWTKVPPAGSNMYPEAVRRAQAAILDGAVIKGILWHQGESNRNDLDYLKKLYTLVEDLRADLGMPDLPFVCGEVNERSDNSYAASVGFNERLNLAPQFIPNCLVVSQEGTSTPDADKSHFDRSSQILLGERYYEAMKTLLTR